MGFRISEGEFGIKLLAPELCSDFYRLGVLYIPKGVQVYDSDTLRLLSPPKCRAEKAVVLDIAAVFPIKKLYGNCVFINNIGSAESMYQDNFGNARLVYRKGHVVEPKEPFCETEHECASGIHYYKTPKDLRESYVSDIVLYGMNTLDEHLVTADDVPIEERIDRWFKDVCELFTDNDCPKYPNPWEF